jgi:hypothetical protein
MNLSVMSPVQGLWRLADSDIRGATITVCQFGVKGFVAIVVPVGRRPSMQILHFVCQIGFLEAWDKSETMRLT